MGKKDFCLNRLKVLIVDVDGTMTDGGIYYDENGNELKKFSVRDAAGFFAARKVGIEIVVVTGRECKATSRRMREMGVEHLYQNVKNKNEFLINFMKEYSLNKESVGYIGDDLNDLKSMRLTGFIACPLDACIEVKKIANYISQIKGGNGVVRDVVEYILKGIGKWDWVIDGIYGTGI